MKPTQTPQSVPLDPPFGLKIGSDSTLAYPQLEPLIIAMLENQAGCTNTVNRKPFEPIELNGNTLSLTELRALGMEGKITLSAAAIEAMHASSDIVADAAQSNHPVYGVNTGFGFNSNVIISKDKTAELQKRILRSHATHVGDELPIPTVKRIMALRINTLAKGFSGIRPIVVQALVDLFNSGCTPRVRNQGTVGASGDLVPLAHIGLALLGEGMIFDPKVGRFDEAALVLERHQLSPVELTAKEGLCLINGTQFMAALGFEALDRAINCFRAAFPITGLSLVALLGHPTVFDPRISATRPHPGQMLTADLMRTVTPVGESKVTSKDPQDPYSFRCIPQVYGPIAESLSTILSTFHIEWNSGTDNPLVFTEPEPVLISSGNFHGNIIGLRCDELAIHLSQLSSIAYPRISNLLDPSKSRGLNAFLASDPGLDSGLMTFENVAAALLSEIKAQSNPASVDSIPTCAQKEDHVAMGGFAARKAIDVASNTEKMLAVELLVATHAIHRRIEQDPEFKLPPVLKRLYNLTSKLSPPMSKDRFMEKDYDAILSLIETGRVWQTMPDTLSIDGEGHVWIPPTSKAEQDSLNYPFVPNDYTYLIPPQLNDCGFLSQVKLRNGETKFGELHHCFLDSKGTIGRAYQLSQFIKSRVDNHAKTCFILDASQDDIGARANLGRGQQRGSTLAWDEFLSRFSNIPLSTYNKAFLHQLSVLGSLDLSDILTQTDPLYQNQTTIPQEQLTHFVSIIHSRATRIVRSVFEAGPAVRLAFLNGDHNNMTAIVSGFYQATNQKPIVIYLDHHADCRPVEPGPHSGNWNTQLLSEGLIEKVYLVGLNPMANSDITIENLNQYQVEYQNFTWQEMIEQNRTLTDCAIDIVNDIQSHYKGKPVILSICGDSVAMLPASAGNMAIGFDVESIYRFIAALSILDIRGFNVAELKPSLSQIGTGIVGEFLTQALFTFSKSFVD